MQNKSNLVHIEEVARPPDNNSVRFRKGDTVKVLYPHAGSSEDELTVEGHELVKVLKVFNDGAIFITI